MAPEVYLQNCELQTTRNGNKNLTYKVISHPFKHYHHHSNSINLSNTACLFPWTWIRKSSIERRIRRTAKKCAKK